MREKILKCDQCDKKFTRKDSVQLHLKKKHGFRKVFSCKLCDKHFQSNQDLTAHLKTFHKKKTHVCEKCGKSFPSRSGKSNHKTFVKCQPEDSISTSKENSKRLGCSFCSKTFGQKSSLLRHVKTVHNNSFQCGTCGKEFENETKLENHVVMFT